MSPLTLSGASSESCILFVATCRGEGGIERYSVRIARSLIARGVRIRYVCRPDSFLERECAANAIPTHPLHPRNSGDLIAALSLARTIQEVNAEIVHVHSRRDFFYAALAIRIVRKRKLAGHFPRLVLHSHLDRPLGEPGYLSGRLFQGTADLVIAVSGAVQRRLTAYHHLPEDFIPVVYNGIDLGRFAPPGSDQAEQRRSDARRQFGVPGDALVIGMLGRVNAKGQERLLKMAPDLLGTIPNLHILIVGPGGSQGLRQIVQESGIGGRVTIMGCTDDVASVIPAFDILTHLPESESFGLALVEAMACGIPAVTSDVGGCPEVVQHEISGLVAPLGDDALTMAHITRLLQGAEGTALRRKFGTAGREIVARQFELDRQVTELQGWYDRLCAPVAALRTA